MDWQLTSPVKQMANKTINNTFIRRVFLVTNEFMNDGNNMYVNIFKVNQS